MVQMHRRELLQQLLHLRSCRTILEISANASVLSGFQLLHSCGRYCLLTQHVTMAFMLSPVSLEWLLALFLWQVLSAGPACNQGCHAEHSPPNACMKKPDWQFDHMVRAIWMSLTPLVNCQSDFFIQALMPFTSRPSLTCSSAS